jgi:hypothetical protein
MSPAAASMSIDRRTLNQQQQGQPLHDQQQQQQQQHHHPQDQELLALQSAVQTIAQRIDNLLGSSTQQITGTSSTQDGNIRSFSPVIIRNPDRNKKYRPLDKTYKKALRVNILFLHYLLIFIILNILN